MLDKQGCIEAATLNNNLFFRTWQLWPTTVVDCGDSYEPLIKKIGINEQAVYAT